MLIDATEAATAITDAGRTLHANGWVPATSGNFSMRLADDAIAITVSGCNKGRLNSTDIMSVDLAGNTTSGQKASAELGLHLQLYQRDPMIGAILHTHSVNATVVSQSVAHECRFEGLELLKAFSGISSHESVVTIPVFDNSQDIASLARAVEDYMLQDGQGFGYLIRGHGLYTWGATMSECMRHLEAMEYLLKYFLITARLLPEVGKTHCIGEGNL